MRHSTVYNIFLVLIGIVIGSLVASLTASVPALSWLSYALSFGHPTDFVLDLSVVHINFGLSVNLSVSVILFVILSLVLGRYFAKK